MSAETSKIYPYPVFFPGSEDYSISIFDTGCTITEGTEKILFTFDIKINDAELLRLIDSNQAGLFCLYSCAATKHREVFEVSCDENGHFEKLIDSGTLIGNIEIQCLIVTKEAISDFSNSNFSGFYDGETVDFPEFAIIGHSDVETTFIYKSNFLIGNVPSICDVVRKEDAKEISFDLSNDSKILIFLPPQEYLAYKELKGSMVRTKQSIFFMQVLTSIIEKIKNGLSEDFSSTEWFPVIENALLEIGVKELSEDEMPEEAFVYAQRILSNPIRDAMIEINKQNRRSED